MIWIYSEVWVMGDLELLTESKNIARLPSTEVLKLVPLRTFSGICIGKQERKMNFGQVFLGTRLSESLDFWPSDRYY